ncbi:hypothetical protein FRACYDRAFT_250346 [Fragilariopsis cylindrus CCMP1102]|uniref:Uncharacterized protein n=1 Tax=Fragilariopsis cylindrus CCMP1102 TaxID=635003 RepID=A0A1E7EQ79_9STRA|nr:hypothetical protein FRACYDRAFT_250346 [Fragilariopsis cylindrus CCMP1102]|eukprot:OEU08122.1 hypothetical protein FRACYDRAFT_250346 [Fragilariopsis cylindrus CCMP1102]
MADLVRYEKHGILEGGYNKLYQVNAGKWISTEESQVADWYHMQTGIISQTICITTEAPLRAYKLFARVYSGKGDDLKISMYKMSIHIITKLKMVPQSNIMLQSSKHEGCYLIIDWMMPCVRPVENGHREGHP